MDAVFPRYGDVPTVLDHVGRGTEPDTGHCPCWSSEYLVPAIPFLFAYQPTNQAVDVVGQAGKPRTISGFQTHSTPVRLGTTERAELATEEFIPFAHVLEGFVILQKNPGWEKEDKMEL